MQRRYLSWIRKALFLAALLILLFIVYRECASAGVDAVFPPIWLVGTVFCTSRLFDLVKSAGFSEASRMAGIPCGLRTAVGVYYRCCFIEIVTGTGKVGGDVARFFALSGTRAEKIKAVLYFRSSAGLALLVPLPFLLFPEYWPLFLGAAFLLAVLTAAAFRLRGDPARVETGARLLYISLFHLAGLVIAVFQYALVLRIMFGMPLESILFPIYAGLVAGVLSYIPAGMGVRDAGMALLLRGVTIGQLGAISIVIRMVGEFFACAVGLVLSYRAKTVQPSEPAE